MAAQFRLTMAAELQNRALNLFVFCARDQRLNTELMNRKFTQPPPFRSSP
jgi:hypothetical protein